MLQPNFTHKLPLILFYFIAFSLVIPTNAQENTPDILLIATKDLGNQNLKDDSKYSIPTTNIKLSEDIFHYYIDTSQNKIYLRTRKLSKKKKHYKAKGHITSLDMSSYKLDWQDIINYNRSFASIKNQYMVMNRLSKNVMVDLATGKNLWEVKNRI